MDQLKQATHVLIKQRVEWIECIPCCEQTNEYTIYSTDGNMSTTGAEIGKFTETTTNAVCIYCAKCLREYSFDLKIGNQTYTQTRPYKVPVNCLACVDCFKQQSKYSTPSNQQTGSAEWPCWCVLNPSRGLLSCQELDIKDKSGNLQYTLTAPCLQTGFLCFCLGFLDFAKIREYKIMNAEKKQVGKIVNIYNDCINELCNRADNFGIEFPQNCDDDTKINLIQTAIFIDFLQYMG